MPVPWPLPPWFFASSSTSSTPAPTKPAAGNRHAERSEATRAQLIQAAIQVVRDKGYQGASVFEVAKAAGLTPGAFQHHFGTKAVLMMRVVDELEERYPAFNGLNLSFETREGILKHCSRRHAEMLEAFEPNGVGRRFLDNTQPSMEAQLCNLADEIAYNAHDIDDGVRSGLITVEQLDVVPLFTRFRDESLKEFPHVQGRRLLFDAIRRMLSQQVYDVIDATQARIAEYMPLTADEARTCPPLVRFTAEMRDASTQLKRFLFKALYRHEQVNDTTARAKQVVVELFEVYVDRPQDMPDDFAQRGDRHRAVADYIAGMTDRFAIREHERLTGQRLFQDH